jgi:hypothetical protein
MALEPPGSLKIDAIAGFREQLYFAAGEGQPK